MPDYYRVKPEVAGGLGEHTVIERESVPPKVSRLHYVFDGWMGDDLLSTYPCYIITTTMAEKLSQLGATGFNLHEAEISTSGEFEDRYPGRRLPPFLWLMVTGTAMQHDFGLDEKGRLVVSAQALSWLRTGQLAHARVETMPDR